MAEAPVQYKVFVRVPFNRGDFVDPPDPNWNPTKDKELWRILSSASKGKDIDWHGLADKFDVTLAFLLQQAAWLYERQLSQVREQLRRVNKPSTSADASPSPPPPSDSAATSIAAPGAQPMKRGLSLGQSSLGKPPSNLTLRTKRSDEVGRGSPAASPVQDRPQRAPYSRTASANTITQLQKSAFSPIAGSGSSPKSPATGQESMIRRTSQQTRQVVSPAEDSPKASPSPSESSSDDDDAPPLGQSRAFQRRPRFSSIMTKGKSRAHGGGRGGLDSVADAAEDSEDSDSEFLPFAAAPTTQATNTKPSTARSAAVGTSRPSVGSARPPNASKQAPSSRQTYTPQTPRPATTTAPESDPTSPISASASASAASQSSQGVSVSASHPSLPPNDHRAALAALSPRQRRSVARDGSDTGTPSMGSSFSDLDDASVSMSAMEEALAHQMRGGNGGGGVGTAAASALRGSLAVGMNMGGLWKGRGAGAGGGGNGPGRGRGV